MSFQCDLLEWKKIKSKNSRQYKNLLVERIGRALYEQTVDEHWHLQGRPNHVFFRWNNLDVQMKQAWIAKAIEILGGEHGY